MPALSSASAHPTPPLASRLPRVGTTIFSVMSALAQQHGAVNLGQGFPDVDCDPKLPAAVTDAMRRGLNQYPPMAGVPQLRDAVSAKIEALYGTHYDPADEITITAGATQAILSVILAVVHPGDEVIVLEAIDSDVIKTYVRLGLGVGIVAEMAMRNEPPGGDLVARPVGHLFGQNVARVAFKRGVYLRNFIYAFAELISSRLSRTLIQRAISGDASADYEL